MCINIMFTIFLLTLASCVVSESFQQSIEHHQNVANIANNSNYTTAINERSPEARFGLPITYGNDLHGYGAGNNPPVKIELGGLFLGTIIGLGAILLIPKLSHLLSSPEHHYGHSYFRSLTDTDNLYNGFSQAISRFEEVLNKHHIDSVNCLERAACSYAKSTIINGTQLLNNGNVLMKFAIEGTKFKTALDHGMSGEDCTLIYPHCNFSKQLIISGIKTAILDNKL